MHDGSIVFATYLKNSGWESFYYLHREIAEGTELNYVVEPEVVDDTEVFFRKSVEDLVTFFTELEKEIKEFKRLRPSDKVKLIIDPEFIVKGDQVDSSEYKLLGLISEYGLVGEIYKNSPFDDFQTTINLVKLRKKRALKVIA